MFKGLTKRVEIVMRICFICETPYQIFNAVNYAVNQKDYEDAVIDLYIGDVFQGAREIKGKVGIESIFNNVFLYCYKKENSVSRFIYTAFPNLFINHVVKNENTHSVRYEYDSVFVSTLTSFAMAMIMLNKDAKTCFFDDGISSYVGKIGFSNITKNRRFVYKLIRSDYRHLYPQYYYVNNTKVFQSEWRTNVRNLPDLSEPTNDFLRLLDRIFCKPIMEYKNTKMVLLSQPGYIPIKNTNEKLDIISKSLEGKKYIKRLHPREKRYDCNECVVDNSNSLWEMVCLEYIDDKSLLIGACSTAQITPKLLFNKEPYIIFTHYLYSNINDEEHHKYHNLYKQIKGLYNHPNRVFEVKNEEQMQSVIRIIENENLYI